MLLLLVLVELKGDLMVEVLGVQMEALPHFHPFQHLVEEVVLLIKVENLQEEMVVQVEVVKEVARLVLVYLVKGMLEGKEMEMRPVMVQEAVEEKGPQDPLDQVLLVE
jgi:hypothetical protein